MAREALVDAEAGTLVLAEKLLETAAGETLENLARERGVEVLRVSDSCYQKISRLDNPEGAAVAIKIRRVEIPDLLTPECRLVVTAGLQDPGNAGAIVRVAEAAGATGCLLLDGIDPAHPRLLRGSMGSAFRIPCAGGRTADFIRAAEGSPLRILAATGDGGAIPYRKADYTPPAAVCIGGEGEGLPGEILLAAQQKIAIPMAGRGESLNAAVAAGIILYGTGWGEQSGGSSRG